MLAGTEKAHKSKKACVVLAISRGGCELGLRLASALEADFLPCRGQIQECFRRAWKDYDALVCIMASGIVVRSIAPLLADKRQDPAVVLCDERGHFSVSLLSGHLGGANALARRVARICGGQAVLTTASDVLGLTALDLWCRDLSLTPADKKALTQTMGRLVDRGRLALYSAYPLPPLPPDLRLTPGQEEADVLITARDEGPEGACLLHPQVLCVGLGCNRGTPEAVIRAAVEEAFARHHLALASVAACASIDLKGDEEGLLAFARRFALPLRLFTAEELNRVEGVAESAARRHTGARAVAEPAALLAAGPDARLLAAKMKWPDVTVAIAEKTNPFNIAITG